MFSRLTMALGWVELHVLTIDDGVGLGLGQAQLLLLGFCIGGYGPWPSLPWRPVMCRWLATSVAAGWLGWLPGRAVPGTAFSLLLYDFVLFHRASSLFSVSLYVWDVSPPPANSPSLVM